MTQALEALELANRTRRERAEVKRLIRCGELTVTDVLADPPSSCRRMSILELLRAQHLWGPKRCRRLLREVQISEIRRVEDLTERQRNLTAGML
jgi:hypothetical protein